MASIELRTPKNKPAYYKITANITLNGRTIPASRSVWIWMWRYPA